MVERELVRVDEREWEALCTADEECKLVWKLEGFFFFME
jgi:hypothetical protein